MKWLLLIFLTGFGLNSIAQSEAEAISRIEKRRYEAMTKPDTNYLKFILSEDLVYTHSNGLVESKFDFIQSIVTGKIIYKNIGVKEQRIKLYNKTAIVTGVINVVGVINGKDFDINLRYTNAYIKKDDWKLVVWQSLKL